MREVGCSGGQLAADAGCRAIQLQRCAKPALGSVDEVQTRLCLLDLDLENAGGHASGSVARMPPSPRNPVVWVARVLPLSEKPVTHGTH